VSLDTQTVGRRINELLVLSSLRDKPKHGYQIALDVERETEGAFEFQHGTLYPILHRLDREGAIEGRWTEDGRRRKEYRLTPEGRRLLGEEAGSLATVFDRLMEIIEEVRRASVRPLPSEG
jgi:PadR family transcriptional regulator, regulatory protein PadR